jgi:chromosome segregation ATPase
VESQAETLAELRRLEEKHRGRIYDLERKLVDAERERDKLAADRDETEAKRKLLHEAMTRIVAELSEAAAKYWPDHDPSTIAIATFMGEIERLRAEIETLRKQLANAQREASDEFVERQVLQHEASDVYVELVRLRAFAGKARETISPTMNYCDVEFLLSALAELDAGPSEPTQVAEPLDPDTRDQELERLYSAIDGDLLAEGISHVCREIGEARKHGAVSEPSPVAKPLDAEGGA